MRQQLLLPLLLLPLAWVLAVAADHSCRRLLQEQQPLVKHMRAMLQQKKSKSRRALGPSFVHPCSSSVRQRPAGAAQAPLAT
jgi:hypothetical protein